MAKDCSMTKADHELLLPWLRKREGQVWTADDTARVERTVAEVEAAYQRILAVRRKWRAA